MLLYDAKGNPLILFEDSWGLRWALEREKACSFTKSRLEAWGVMRGALDAEGRE